MTMMPKYFMHDMHDALRHVCALLTNRTVHLLTFLLLPVCLFAALPAAAFALTGDGTADNPYLISSATDLWDFHERVQTNAGAHARLIADITLCLGDSKMWYGMCSDGYAGTFDGGGFTITVKCAGGAESFFGLFWEIDGAGVVRNLAIKADGLHVREFGLIALRNFGTIANCITEGSVVVNGLGENAFGTFVKENFSEGVIDGCENRTDINAVESFAQVGGIVSLNTGAITNCANSGAVTAGAAGLDLSQAGGIAALNLGGKITGCNNSGEVTILGQSQDGTRLNYAGGVAGANIGGEITACKNGGAVAAEVAYSRVGGIVGRSCTDGIAPTASASIKDCANIGTVTAGGKESCAGGVVGDNLAYGVEAAASVSITGCTNAGGVTAVAAGSVAGSVAGKNNGTIM